MEGRGGSLLAGYRRWGSCGMGMEGVNTGAAGLAHVGAVGMATDEGEEVPVGAEVAAAAVVRFATKSKKAEVSGSAMINDYGK